MSESEWPYNLPIWRGAHRASSPDGRFVAEIDPAYEISMGNPTFGTLRLSAGLELERCNPSFVWSEDSRYLAVPRYFRRLGMLRRQRMVVIDTLKRLALASTETAYYFQPESFSRGRLVATKNPFGSAEQIVWDIPADLGSFKPVAAAWAQAAQ
jgi:hypothetical protein